MNCRVVGVSRSEAHSFSKQKLDCIKLIEGHGVEGDVHAGKSIKHTYLANKDPSRKNILQVHLIAAELLDELNDKGFTVAPGQLGENITTGGIDLISLPKGTRLRFGETALIELTALRNPCVQVEKFRQGLLKQVVHKDSEGVIHRKLGVMAIVLAGGEVSPGARVVVVLPQPPYQPLEYIW